MFYSTHTIYRLCVYNGLSGKGKKEIPHRPVGLWKSIHSSANGNVLAAVCGYILGYNYYLLKHSVIILKLVALFFTSLRSKLVALSSSLRSRLYLRRPVR